MHLGIVCTVICVHESIEFEVLSLLLHETYSLVCPESDYWASPPQMASTHAVALFRCCAPALEATEPRNNFVGIVVPDLQAVGSLSTWIVSDSRALVAGCRVHLFDHRIACAGMLCVYVVAGAYVMTYSLAILFVMWNNDVFVPSSRGVDLIFISFDAHSRGVHCSKRMCMNLGPLRMRACSGCHRRSRQS